MDEPSNPPAAAMASGARRRALRMGIAVGVAAMATVLLAWRFWPWRGIISTDDAFIDGRVVQIGSLSAGRVIDIPVADNQHVEAGQILAEIDPAPYRAKLDEAKATLALAEATLSIAEEFAAMTHISTATAVDQAKAELASSEAAVLRDRATAVAVKAEAEHEDADRQRLFALASNLVSVQQRDAATKATEAAQARAAAAAATADATNATVTVAQAKLAATTAGVHQAGAADAGIARCRADVDRAKAAVREAEIALSYTKVVAPCAGTVTRKAVEIGASIQVGQSLLALVSDDLWVVANLKEDQLADIAIGASAEIQVDAYPGVRFAAKIDSVQSGSGARFSLLPAENATGNFVKVVQRVPVKLVFAEQPDRQRFHLGPGMSVEPSIHTR